MLTIADVQRAVAAHFDLSVDDLRSVRRCAPIVGPRHLAMYLARLLTGSSFPFLAKRFGGRDHTTIMNACNRVRAAALDDRYMAELHGLHAKLTAPTGRS